MLHYLRSGRVLGRALFISFCAARSPGSQIEEPVIFANLASVRSLFMGRVYGMGKAFYLGRKARYATRSAVMFDMKKERASIGQVDLSF